MAKGKQKVALKHSERESLKQQMENEAHYERQLQEARDLRPGQIGAVESDRLSVDRELIARRKENMRRVLDEGTPEPVPAHKRPELESERKKLGEALSEMMLTQRQMKMKPSDRYEYHQAVEKSKRYEVGNPRFAEMANRYRQISESLRPDDPDYSSIEKLRQKS